LRLGMIGLCMNNEYRMCTNDKAFTMFFFFMDDALVSVLGMLHL
jgi:hypothetical protein